MRRPPGRLERNGPSRVTFAYGVEGAALDLAEENRKNARACLRLSQQANSLEAQRYWLTMAQFWFNLALHAEDREAIESVSPATLGAPERGKGKAN